MVFQQQKIDWKHQWKRSEQMTALKELQQLAMEFKARKYSNVPAHCLPKIVYSDKDTNSLQTAIIDCIDLHSGWATRVNTQGQWIEKLERHIPSSTKRGTPDIMGVLPGGQFIGVECKKGYDKLSDKQQEVAQDIRTASGIYLEVRDFETFYTAFKEAIKQQTITLWQH